MRFFNSYKFLEKETRYGYALSAGLFYLSRLLDRPDHRAKKAILQTEELG